MVVVCVCLFVCAVCLGEEAVLKEISAELVHQLKNALNSGKRDLKKWAVLYGVLYVSKFK